MTGGDGTGVPTPLSDAVIYDRGYRSYKGERRGRGAIRRAIARDGIRRILGLRRKARRKILPWSLLVIGVVMAAVIIGLHFVAGSIAAGVAEGLPTYPEPIRSLFAGGVAVHRRHRSRTAHPRPDPGRAVRLFLPSDESQQTTWPESSIAYLAVAGAIYVVPQILLHLGLAGSERGRISLLSRIQSRHPLEGPGRGARLSRRARRAAGDPLKPHRPDRVRCRRLSGDPHRGQWDRRA